LLHLAKLMPCQWRTIAPIVGRTAAQCLEHYEKLLDQAQDKEDGVDAADDPRRLRPGEIDPNPESKPARPDPVDMDEDEKEMLSEARARLANTQGKKAKRKAREKQLMEARRIASLQKRRELKAAGIDLPKYRRRRGVDYISEVPFERKAPAGFFAASKEGDEAEGSTAFKKISLEGLDGKRRDKEEEEERKRDKKRQKTKQEKNMPAAVMEINKLNDAEQVRKRSKLVLGAPQVNEEELDEIAKLQERGMAPTDDDGNAATRTLMGDYTDRTPALAGRTPMRTPKSDGDMLRQEAQNLISLTNGETPLKGGLNTPLHESDFSGATPKPRSAQTPNPIATPLRPGATPGRGGITPVLQSGSRGATPSSTPLRDQLGLNDDPEAALRSREHNRALKSGLSSLPSAKNQYQIMVPEAPSDEAPVGAQMEEDAADVAEREAKYLHAREKQAMKERSTPLKRKLPRPIACDEENIVSSNKSQANDPEYLLEKEMYEMVQDDGVRFPVRANGVTQSDDPQYVLRSKSSLPYYDPEELAAASNLLKEELVDLLETKGITKEDDSDLWTQAVDELIFLPQKTAYCSQTQVSEEEIHTAYSALHNELKQQMGKDAKKANKLEKKLQTLTAGYQNRAQQLIEEIQTMHAEQETKSQELSCYTALKAQEAAALPARLKTLQEEVEIATQREKRLQTEFQEKMEELSELKKST